MPAIDRRDQIGQMWKLLAIAAGEHRTMTYTELAKQIQPPVSPRRIGGYLFHIKEYCKKHNLPHLNAVCVAATTRLPTDPDYEGQDKAAIVQKAFAYNWWTRPDLPLDFREQPGS